MSHGPQFEIEQSIHDAGAYRPCFSRGRLIPGSSSLYCSPSSIYLRGWRQLHRRLPRRFAVWRLIAFQAGLLTLFLALASPLHPLAELLLQFHMIQHLLLMMVVPPLLLLGAPLLPLLRGLPRPVLQHGLGLLVRLYGRFSDWASFLHPSDRLFGCVHSEYYRLARTQFV